MKPVIIIAIAVLIVSVSITSISAQTQSDIPSWVKGVADFWVKGNISDNEFGEAISFLIEQEILNVEIPQQANNLELEHKISQLESENTKLRLENTNLKNENSKLQSESNSINPSNQDPITQKEPSTVKSKDIRDLLPNESDIGKKWKIFDTGTLTANSKTFHFETGRVSNYSKDVSILKKFVMAVYQFSDVDSAKEGLEWQRFDVRTKDGGYNGENLLLNDDECIVTHWPGGTTDKVYGYCIEKNYLVYGYLEGYYSDMESDFMNFMQITRDKI